MYRFQCINVQLNFYRFGIARTKPDSHFLLKHGNLTILTGTYYFKHVTLFLNCDEAI